MGEQSGHMSIRLRAHQLAEQDIQDYGPIERSDQKLESRAEYHVRQMQAHLQTLQAVLIDDVDAFTSLVAEYYAVIYKGLLVAYTGLKEPFRLTAEPRYVTSVNLDDSEDEHNFLGLVGLLEITKGEQATRRANAETDGCNPDEYLLTMVQITIVDMKHINPDGPRCFIAYDIMGDQITGVYEREGVSDEVLYGLGLPFAETIVSTTTEK